MNRPTALSLAATSLWMAAAWAADTNAPLVRQEGERYRYTAVVLTGEHRGVAETLDLSFAWVGTNIECRSLATATNVRETAVVLVTAAGTLISAAQESARYGKEYAARVSFEKGQILATRTEDGKLSVKKKSPAADLPVVSDLSLLTFLRTQPLGRGTVGRIQLADYAQYVVPASVRHAGEETVQVPAGAFPCHRVEVTIETFWYRKTMTYWIARAWPHVVVKHTGIRGAFTPEYDTTLTTILEPDAAIRPTARAGDE